MLGMAGALPDYQGSRSSQAPQQSQQRQHLSHMAMNPNFSPQQGPQFANQTPTPGANYSQLPVQYQTPYQHPAPQAYAQTQSTPHPHPTGNPSQGGFAGNPYFPGAQPQAFSYYPGQFAPVGQSQHGPPGQQGIYSTPYGRPSGQVYGQGVTTSSHAHQRDTWDRRLTKHVVQVYRCLMAMDPPYLP